MHSGETAVTGFHRRPVMRSNCQIQLLAAEEPLMAGMPATLNHEKGRFTVFRAWQLCFHLRLSASICGHFQFG
jgi:hypothetical protein